MLDYFYKLLKYKKLKISGPTIDDNGCYPKSVVKETPQILIFCGAGISAESDIPTFRTGDDGLWNNYDIDEVCNIRNFYKNKESVFNFYNERKKEYKNAKPNCAHFSLAKIQKIYGNENVKIYTSNIDNLLEMAGCKNVVHVHGSINQMNCINCQHIWNIGDSEFIIDTDCPQCTANSGTKPGVTFFNEASPEYIGLFYDFSKGKIYKNNEFVPLIKIIIGTSLKVINEGHLQTERGASLLLDPYPDNQHHFTKIIPKKATEGIVEMENFIKENYKL